MTLAVMVSRDKEALICDLAETYHILDYKALPVPLLAVLASGLRDDSRIKMELAGMNHIPADIVIPQMADNISLIRYSLTAGEDAPAPAMLTQIMTGSDIKKETKGFSSPAEFEEARRRILEG